MDEDTITIELDQKIIDKLKRIAKEKKITLEALCLQILKEELAKEK